MKTKSIKKKKKTDLSKSIKGGFADDIGTIVKAPINIGTSTLKIAQNIIGILTPL